MNWKKSSELMLENIGGKDNVTQLVHCATRLRFNVKDINKVNKEAIEKIDGVISSQWSGKQYQIIIGQDVSTPYQEILNLLGLQQQSESKVDSSERGSHFEQIIDTISGIFTPILSAIVGCALLKTLLVLLTTFNLLSDKSQTYLVLSFVSDTVFYFMPVFLAISAANKLKMNLYVAGVLGAMLIHPNFISMVTEGAPVQLFGAIPLTLVSYSSSVIPAVLSVWIATHVEKWVDKISPKTIKFFFKPFLTIVIMIPIAFCAIGPLGTWVGVIAKKKDFKALAFSTGISSLLCVNEPALYGVHLKLKKPFLALMIGGGVGGILAGIVGLKRITFASTSLLTLPIFIDSNNGMNIIWAVVCAALAGAISFALTIVLCKKDKKIMEEIS